MNQLRHLHGSSSQVTQDKNRKQGTSWWILISGMSVMLIVGGDRVEFREGEEVVMGFITFPPPQLPLSVASPAVK